MSGFTYDVIIIGGGVAGCAVARELARYRARIALLERAEDVCSGASKANSGIVHAGFDAAPGTAKARFNLLGNRQMGALARELDFEFARCGSLVLCLDEADRPRLEALAVRGRQNGVPGLEILPGDEVRRREPMVSERCVAALWAPTGGIVCPFGLTIALAENACDNGVTFLPLTEVTAIARMGGGYRVETGRGALTARCVVNAAGVYADVLHNQVSARRLHITPRKGDYCLLDKTAGGHVRSTIFQLPGAAGIPCLCGTMVIGLTPGRAVTAVSREHGLFTLQAGAVVLAMGCRERPRGALNIPGTRPAGVYTAGTAQRLMNIEGLRVGREVVVLGSGDIGLIMARRMKLEGAEVRAVAELMPYSGGLKRNIVQCLDDFGIPLLLSHTVVEVHGRQRVTGVTLAAVDAQRRPVPGNEKYIPCDTLLLSVGLLPENELMWTRCSSKQNTWSSCR